MTVMMTAIVVVILNEKTLIFTKRYYGVGGVNRVTKDYIIIMQSDTKVTFLMHFLSNPVSHFPSDIKYGHSRGQSDTNSLKSSDQIVLVIW